MNLENCTSRELFKDCWRVHFDKDRDVFTITKRYVRTFNVLKRSLLVENIKQEWSLEKLFPVMDADNLCKVLEYLVLLTNKENNKEKLDVTFF